MQGMVRTLTLQGFQRKSDVIKFHFTRLTLAVVWRTNKRNTTRAARGTLQSSSREIVVP